MTEKTKPEWETEPDELCFTDDRTGYNCVILRSKNYGVLLGYVILPKCSKLYKLYERSDKDGFHNNPVLFGNIYVHGGLSYGGDDIPFF